MKKFILTFFLAFAPLVAFAASGTAIPGGNHATPFIIDKPGAYYLAGNRVATNPGLYAAIEVAAQNVTLDLNGFTVGFDTDVDNANGFGNIIVCSKSNFELKNGVLSKAPSCAVFITSGVSSRLLDVRVSGTRGIRFWSAGTRVERCQVADARGCGIWAGAAGALVKNCSATNIVKGDVQGMGIALGLESSAIECEVAITDGNGIEAGSETSVEDCRVRLANRNKNVLGAGIFLSGTGTTARRNTITNVSGSGIHVYGNSDGIVVEHNAITTVAYATGQYGHGIYSDSQSAMLRGNTATHTDGAFIAGTYTNLGDNFGN